MSEQRGPTPRSHAMIFSYENSPKPSPKLLHAWTIEMATTTNSTWNIRIKGNTITMMVTIDICNSVVMRGG